MCSKQASVEEIQFRQGTTADSAAQTGRNRDGNTGKERKTLVSDDKDGLSPK